MTRNIDENIVDMKFNNKQFENGISTSLRSIDRLKKGLNFDGAARSLSELERAGRNFSLVGISDTLDSISSKFSALGVIGFTVIQNLTNSALNMSKRIISALTIDPITTGLNEYETKMNAIQTILTNTASKGTTLNQVIAALDELNTYSDKTIYNFAEMARNIGTFTAAGVGLERSVLAIKGIANLGAGSGSLPMQVNTAMYQLSQALAAGSVKLIDWNSVVNAGMGGELFQNALRKTAKEMGIFVDKSKPFRETLEQGWLTSEVLIKTLEKFANDPLLIKAATQVKTFTQLIGTMKESMQSGWAKSWEYIIGNKDQAAKFFTSINDGFNKIVGASADARNATLAFWNSDTSGGREAMIQGLTNVLKGIQSVITPITKGFREIFPKVTAQQLIDISKAFRNITQDFKIGATTANNLKNTFKGLFALLDIGKQVFSGLFSVLTGVIHFLLPIVDGVLLLTGSFGKFIVSIDEALKSSDGFMAGMKKLGSIVMPIAEGMRTVVVALFTALASLGQMDMSGFENVGKHFQLAFKPFESIADLARGLATIFYSVANAIGKVFEKFRQFIANSFELVDYNTVFDMINSGLIAGILISIKKFVDNLSGLTKKTGGILGGLTSTLNGVTGSLQALQSSLKAGVLLKIAISMGILAAALLTLSGIDSKKLTTSLGAITTLFLELFGAMAAFDFIAGTAGIIAMFKLTTGMILLSAAVLILSHAMQNLMRLDWNDVAKGLFGLAGMTGVLILAAKLLAGTSGMLIKSSVGFVIFAAAINVMAMAVDKLGKFSGAKLTKGLVGIGVLLAELALFMKVTALNKLGMIRATGILIFAAAMNVLASAVGKLASMKPGELFQGLTGVAVMLGQIVIFSNLMGKQKGIISTAISLTIIGGALLVLSNAVGAMSTLSWEQIGRGLAVLAGSLTAITLAFKFLPKSIFVQSIAIMDVAGAMTFLAKALEKMAELSWEQIVRGLTAMALSLGLVITAFMLLKKGTLVDSTSFLILSTAIVVLARALGTLGKMSIPQLGMSLLVLASAFLFFGIAGMVLSPLIPVILGLSAAFAIFGVGIFALGAGITMLSAGLTGLAVSGAASATAIVAIISGIAGSIPFVFKSLGQGVVEFAVALANSTQAITTSIVKIGLAILSGLGGLIPKVLNIVSKLIISLLGVIEKSTPKIIKSGMHILISFLKGISEHIGEVVTTAITVMVNFINGIAKKLPALIDAGFNLMVAFIQGMADAVEKNAGIVFHAVLDLILALPKAALKGLDKSIDEFFKIGVDLIQGMINGIKSMISAVSNTVGDMGSTIVAAAKDVLGIHSPSTIFEMEVGNMIGKGLAKGIEKSGIEAVAASTKVSKKVVKASKDSFEKSTEWINDRKYYNQLTLTAELAAWERLQNRYKKGSEERIKIDKEVYRVQQELRKAGYDNSVDWINDRKYYNELGLVDELAAWKRVQKRYGQGSKEREEAEKEIYRVQQEINSLNKDYTTQEAQIRKDANDKRKELEDDYYAKTKEINDKLKDDIQSVTDEYNYALESRSNSLYTSYGLFDKVDKRSANGTTLISNLQSQIKAFQAWQSNLEGLSGKGVDSALIQELRDLGPQSAAEIEALNKLTSDKLATYVSLWRTKHEEADEQATMELSSMRRKMVNEISQLNIDSAAELSKTKAAWIQATTDLNISTSTQLSELQTNWSTKMGYLRTVAEAEFVAMGANVQTSVQTMRTGTEKEATTLATNVKNIMAGQDWPSVGINIVAGIQQGMRAKSPDLARESAKVALMALASAKSALNIKSPSKAFEEVGIFSVQGFINGLSNLVGVASSAKTMGQTAIDSLRSALSNVANSVNGDLDLVPTIRPVLDLTDVDAGKKKLNGLLTTGTGIKVSSANEIASSISRTIKGNNTSTSDSKSGKAGQDQNGSTVSFGKLFEGAIFNVRTDNDIDKIADAVTQKIYKAERTFSRGRGLVTT